MEANRAVERDLFLEPLELIHHFGRRAVDDYFVDVAFHTLRLLGCAGPGRGIGIQGPFGALADDRMRGIVRAGDGQQTPWAYRGCSQTRAAPVRLGSAPGASVAAQASSVGLLPRTSMDDGVRWKT